MKAKTFFVATLVFLVGAAGAAATVLHFELRASVPEADATVAPPAEVRLLFTEAPADNSIGIRLIDRAGEPVETTEPAVDPENAIAFFVKPSAPLTPGPYTVSWRGIGDDGHVVRGEFGFTVAAQ